MKCSGVVHNGAMPKLALLGIQRLVQRSSVPTHTLLHLIPLVLGKEKYSSV